MEYGLKFVYVERSVVEVKFNFEVVEVKLYDIECKNLSMNGIKFNEFVLDVKVKINLQYLFKWQKLDEVWYIVDIYKYVVVVFLYC